MMLSRRVVAVAGAGAVLASSIAVGPAFAQSADEAALSAAIEDLRLGLMKADKAKLEAVAAPELSYGHSAGRIENRQQFIDAVMKRKAVVTSLAFTDQKNTIHGNSAISRHFYESTSELDGKQTSIRIGVLQVWQKQDGRWKLFARQAYVLPKM